MSVEAEDPDDGDLMDQSQVREDSDVSNDSSQESSDEEASQRQVVDDSFGSVQILQLTDQERHDQLTQLDEELCDSLQQVHDLMAKRGMTKSLKVLDTGFTVGQPRIAEQPTRRTPKAGNKVTAAEADTGLSRLRVNENLNFNHKPSDNNRHKVSEISKSVEMIYKNAVQKRVSSSSEECVDISDETLNLFSDAEFVPDYEDDMTVDDVQPSTSGHRPPGPPQPQCVQPKPTDDVLPTPQLSVEEQSDRMIAEAEVAHAKIYTAGTGKKSPSSFEFTAKIDEDYLVVGAHIDETVRQKIGRGEYIRLWQIVAQGSYFG